LQIVFTLPDKLSNLILANRGVLYRLLMKTVWDELKRIMRKLGIRPSAMLVLHTWNQRLKHHPHIHVLIPMAGISLDGTSWVSIENDPQFQAGTNWPLSKRFRQTFCRRLNLFNQRGRLNLPGTLKCLKPTELQSPKNHVSPMQEWLQPIAPHGFRVFIQPPPQFRVASPSASTTTDQQLSCPPDRLLKYLACYVGGGPIADHRLVRWENGKVTFLARSREDEKEDEQMLLFSDSDPSSDAASESSRRSPLATRHCTGINLPLSVTKSKEEITISEQEFVRRWAIHILPKYFMRVQHYGATSRRKGTEYLAQCCKMLEISDAESANAKVDKKSGAKSKDESKSPSADDLEDVLKLMYGKEEEEKPYEPTWKCTKCGKLMKCLEFQLRPSWKIILADFMPQSSNEIQTRLWTADEIRNLQKTKTSPLIMDSS
jgi:hypothetical protein